VILASLGCGILMKIIRAPFRAGANKVQYILYCYNNTILHYNFDRFVLYLMYCIRGATIYILPVLWVIQDPLYSKNVTRVVHMALSVLSFFLAAAQSTNQIWQPAGPRGLLAIMIY